MIVLGIETATVQVGCALGGQEGLLASFHAARGRRHAETLVPAIDFVARAAGVELAQVGVVAVDVGPGLFTGLRVGLATAKSIAQALRVPMIGLTSLDLLAHQVSRSPRPIAAMVDARRGEVYWALYRHVPGGAQRIGDYRIGPVDDVVAELIALGEDALLVGDGALRYRSELEDVLASAEIGGVAHAYPSATDLVELAHPRALREEFVQPRDLHPLYLRKSDAEINWEHKGA